MIYACGFWFLLGLILGWVGRTATLAGLDRKTDISNATRPAPTPAAALTPSPGDQSTSFDETTVQRGIDDLTQQARAIGVPLSPAEARAFVLAHLRGEEA